jgi:hypothetical protein
VVKSQQTTVDTGEVKVKNQPSIINGNDADVAEVRTWQMATGVTEVLMYNTPKN